MHPDRRHSRRCVFVARHVVLGSCAGRVRVGGGSRHATKDLGAARTAAFSNLVPVVALTVAWVFLHEAPRPLQLTGGGLVVAGLLMWRTARQST